MTHSKLALKDQPPTLEGTIPSNMINKEPLLVHIVPHSYNRDFASFVEQYFEGREEPLMQEHFDKVFDSVVRAISKDPTRTFTHYEVKHFKSWYERQAQEVQDKIWSWLHAGNFEIVNGGWDLHDDACPAY